MHLIRCGATYETNTQFRRCIRLIMTDPTDLDKFKSLDEFNSLHTSHNRRI